MKAICSSETSVETQRITRRHIPEDDTPHNFHFIFWFEKIGGKAYCSHWFTKKCWLVLLKCPIVSSHKTFFKQFKDYSIKFGMNIMPFKYLPRIINNTITVPMQNLRYHFKFRSWSYVYCKFVGFCFAEHISHLKSILISWLMTVKIVNFVSFWSNISAHSSDILPHL
jgi:hypothetical protein